MSTHSPWQRLAPGLQTKSQTPPLQVGVARSGVAQAAPHAPQCATLVMRSTHSLPHWLLSPLQSTLHTPLEHTCPGPQYLPHAPQFSELELVSTHLPSQLV
jgi:hypothetical protein